MVELLERAKALARYHTMELPGLTTDGLFDLRPHVPAHGLPASLAGRRALEVGAWDGCWAFELERRGAEEVAMPSRRAWREMLWHAGFDDVGERSRLVMRPREGWKLRHVVHHAVRRPS
jgi:hypothetical protein